VVSARAEAAAIAAIDRALAITCNLVRRRI